MFGRKARLPINITADPLISPTERLIEFNQMPGPNECKMQEERNKMDIEVKSNIQEAQKKQKMYYDRKHGAPSSLFNVGSLVLKKDFTRKKRKGGKLDRRWVGPYQIIGLLGKGLYKIQKLGSDEVRHYYMYFIHV